MYIKGAKKAKRLKRPKRLERIKKFARPAQECSKVPKYVPIFRAFFLTVSDRFKPTVNRVQLGFSSS